MTVPEAPKGPADPEPAEPEQFEKPDGPRRSIGVKNFDPTSSIPLAPDPLGPEKDRSEPELKAAEHAARQDNEVDPLA
jgi:hypothetical protein